MSIVVFGSIYLFGVFAFFKHAADTAPLCDEDGNPIVVQLRRRPAANRN